MTALVRAVDDNLIGSVLDVGSGTGRVPRHLEAKRPALRLVAPSPRPNSAAPAGKGYSISEGDGLFYSCSVFNDLPVLKGACSSVRLIDAAGRGPDLYRKSPDVTVLALK